MKQKSLPIKSGLTTFARIVIFLVGIAALSVCTILLPELAREEAVGKPVNLYVTYGFLAGAYILATPFFVALYQTLKLLNYIEGNKAFSHQSIRTLQNIKKCTIAFSVLVVIAVIVGLSISRIMDPKEDVTFMVTFGLILTSLSGVITAFIAVLQKLLVDAVSMKSENDLIV